MIYLNLYILFHTKNLSQYTGILYNCITNIYSYVIVLRLFFLNFSSQNVFISFVVLNS